MGTFQIDFGESRKSKIVGIDLGTTNSLVAYMDLTGPRIVEDSEGPSDCALGGFADGRREADCGRCGARCAVDAFGAYGVFGEAVDGARRGGCEEELKLFPFRIDPASESVIQLKLGNRTFTPPEISAAVLKQLCACRYGYAVNSING